MLRIKRDSFQTIELTSESHNVFLSHTIHRRIVDLNKSCFCLLDDKEIIIFAFAN